MNRRNIIRDWVKALRSGRYKQTEGTLRYQKGTGKPKYCCLGVLCQRLGLEYNKVDGYTYGNAHSTACLPFPLLSALNLASSFEKRLIHANDSEGKNFAEIADMISNEYL